MRQQEDDGIEKLTVCLRLDTVCKMLVDDDGCVIDYTNIYNGSSQKKCETTELSTALTFTEQPAAFFKISIFPQT